MFMELKAKGQTSRIVYHRMMENPHLLVKKRQNLNEICEFDYTNKEFVQFITRINAYTIHVKIRSFQYI